MKILFIDHHDSFSNNIISFFAARKCDVTYCLYTSLTKKNDSFYHEFDAIVLSPGPGAPKDYPQTINFYKSLPATIPVLGICLGLQIMLFVDGGKITQVYQKPSHGKQLKLNKNISSQYLGVKKLNGTLVLYHSLGYYIKDPVFQKWNLLLEHNGICLIAEHKKKFNFGMQFHPESFASTIGSLLLTQFIRSIKKL